MQPVARLIAERYGSVKVIVSEAFLYVLDSKIYDIAGSYDLMWVVSAALGLATAAIHWPINDKPLDRFAPQVNLARPLSSSKHRKILGIFEVEFFGTSTNGTRL